MVHAAEPVLVGRSAAGGDACSTAGKRRAQVDLSEAAYDASVATYRQTVLTAFQQVEDQLSSLRILEQEAAAEAEARGGRAGIARHRQRAIPRRHDRLSAGDHVADGGCCRVSDRRIDILTRRLTASVLLIEALGGGWDESQLPSVD